MIDLREAILLVLLRLPGPWEHPATAEPASERAARLETIARATAVVADEGADGWRWSARELAAALIVTTYDESGRFRRDVHEGTRRGDCGSGDCKAACLGQLHSGTLVSRAEWRASMGTGPEATETCIRATARVLGASARCVGRGRDMSSAQFSRVAMMYGTGARCAPALPFARSRGRDWQEIDLRLEDLLHPTRSALAMLH